MTKRYLVTPALTYANGGIHLGHLVEYIQVDIFVRALRMAKKDVLFIAGADAHGTPIEINARKNGLEPAIFVEKCRLEHAKSLAAFGIEMDGAYGSTHTPENERNSQAVFKKLQDAGHIAVRDVEQLFDEKEQRFLPDRLVRGSCPKCKAADQYGDSCEVCGSTYRPTELINPKSALSDSTPVLKSSAHYFFELGKYTEQLKEWINSPNTLQDEVRKSLAGWLEDGLKDWDISRDGPYFGFKIPGEDNKYFYVWLDAPIGYISLSEKAAQIKGQSVDDYWHSEDCEIFHFIGKDIVYFHTLFWPAMLMGAGYQLPKAVCVHGMLTINGEKMSKSRGTFILADTFSKHIDPALLRFYLASKLTPKIEDIDLNLEEFAQRVNSGLINKVINIVSRAIPLLHRYCDGKIGALDSQDAQALITKAQQVASASYNLYFARDTAAVVRDILELADEANKYLQDQAPWKYAQQDPIRARDILTTGIWAGKICIGLLKPIMPKLASQLEEMLKIETMNFDNILDIIPAESIIDNYTHLMQRLEAEKMTEILDKAPAEKQEEKVAPALKNIDIGTFASMELRAARVLSAADVEGSDKLICVQVDLGELGKRQIFSGLRPHASAESLIGKMVLVIANLAPRKMRFGTSEGMILAVGNNPPRPIFLDDAAQPGDKVT